jgi:hypothetical protein
VREKSYEVIMHATIILAEERDRNRRLRELGLVLPGNADPRWGLLEAIRAAIAGRAGTTDNDARSVPGYNAWSFPTRRLREVYRGFGSWDKFEENGVEGIINPELKLKVVAVSTDEGTCDPNHSPRNRTPKGPATGKVIDLNSQLSLFGTEMVAAQQDTYQTWQLCTFDNGNDVRAELSCPVNFSGNHFLKFSERVFLIEADEWKKIAVIAADDGEDIEPEVRRRR